jgi:hypothetical protein
VLHSAKREPDLFGCCILAEESVVGRPWNFVSSARRGDTCLTGTGRQTECCWGTEERQFELCATKENSLTRRTVKHIEKIVRRKLDSPPAGLRVPSTNRPFTLKCTRVLTDTKPNAEWSVEYDVVKNPGGLLGYRHEQSNGPSGRNTLR